MKMLSKIPRICLPDNPNSSAILNDLGFFRLINRAFQLTVNGFIS